MTDDPEPSPDRSPPARPVRVARFDGFSTPDGEPEDVAGGRRVADLAGLGDPARSGSRVADFDALEVPPAAPAPVVALDAVVARARNRSAEDAVGSAGRGTGHRSAPDAGAGGGDGRPDDLPPDGPLPRGRRRRARLDPDAPVPDEPQPVADPVAVAREICLRLLTERARTRQELAQALARKDVPADAAAAVLDRFDEVGLIDDAAFAGQWVRSRHAHRGLGRRAIAVELRRKGVADEVAREALTEVDADAEAQRARELVDRKLRSLRVDTAQHRASTARRLVGMLARKGYGASTAYGVVREALAAHGADVDELGTEPAD